MPLFWEIWFALVGYLVWERRDRIARWWRGNPDPVIQRRVNVSFARFLGLFVAIFLAIIFLLGAAFAQSQQTFRDSNGQTTGYAYTDRHGNTTFYNMNHQTTGRSSTNNSGTTTFYDNMGRQTGTARRK